MNEIPKTSIKYLIIKIKVIKSSVVQWNYIGLLPIFGKTLKNISLIL